MQESTVPKMLPERNPIKHKRWMPTSDDTSRSRCRGGEINKNNDGTEWVFAMENPAEFTPNRMVTPESASRLLRTDIINWLHEGWLLLGRVDEGQHHRQRTWIRENRDTTADQHNEGTPNNSMEHVSGRSPRRRGEG